MVCEFQKTKNPRVGPSRVLKKEFLPESCQKNSTGLISRVYFS